MVGEEQTWETTRLRLSCAAPVSWLCFHICCAVPATLVPHSSYSRDNALSWKEIAKCLTHGTIPEMKCCRDVFKPDEEDVQDSRWKVFSR